MVTIEDFPSANQITRLQIECVDRWHQHPIDTTGKGLLGLIRKQHAYNFQLWHQEDEARDPTATDTDLARIKRTIDSLNQSRNDMIEQLDDVVSEFVSELGIRAEDAPFNSETIGSIVDRLSIMALRIYHYQEQADRDDVESEHHARVGLRIALCQQQHADLSRCLDELIDDTFAGRKQHRTYRQLKMYNDPTLNPSVYKSSS